MNNQEDAMTDSKEIAQSIEHVAIALRLLGNADAATPMGALEAHGAVVLEASRYIGDSLCEIALALNDVAEAIREGKQP